MSVFNSRRKYTLAALAAAVVGATACNQIIGLTGEYELEPDAGGELEDGSTGGPDSTIGPGTDATISDGGGSDAELDASDGGPIVYLNWADAGSWSVYDVPGMGTAYVGGTFDGRYVYFTPVDHTSKVLRYDTTMPFEAAGSFAVFDAPGMLGTQGFYGAAYDGRYVYFAGGNAASGTPYLSARFDTKNAGGFTALASWEKFDTRILTPDAGSLDAGDAEAGPPVGEQGFGGTFYDGTGFVYFVPFGTGAGAGETQGIVTRFSIDAGFADASAWNAFDTEAQVNGALSGLTGGLFDGRYAYFIPQAGTAAARYDSTLPFNDAGSWTTYPLATDGGEYLGAASDGKHLYAAPNVATAPVEQTPLGGAFADASAWTATALASTTGTYQGMAFDGRYLYIVPYQSTTIIQRLDTGPDASTAWSPLNLLNVSVDAGDAGAASLAGGVFDGQYLYFPTWGAQVPSIVRLEVTTTKQPLPAGLRGGSFL